MSTYRPPAASTGASRERVLLLGRCERDLPAGQARAVAAYLDNTACPAPTQRQAATMLGVSVNTLKTQLRRVRIGQPAVWAAIEAERMRQRTRRHAAAQTRASRHSRDWHRRQFYQAYGYWPYEKWPQGKQPASPRERTTGTATPVEPLRNEVSPARPWDGLFMRGIRAARGS